MPESGFAVSVEAATVSEYQYYEFQALDRPLGEEDGRGGPQSAGGAVVARADLQANSLDLAEDAVTLADALILDSGDAKDSYWNKEAKALIAGIIMHVAAKEKPAVHTRCRMRRSGGFLSFDGRQSPRYPVAKGQWRR
jgi:hypothetical protein